MAAADRFLAKTTAANGRAIAEAAGCGLYSVLAVFDLTVDSNPKLTTGTSH